jgi:hypothetical protein
MHTIASKKHPDPVVEAQVQRTLARYQGIATPAMLATMRERLEDMLTHDPLAVAMLEQVRDHAAPDQSGTNPVDGDAQGDKAGGGAEGA